MKNLLGRVNQPVTTQITKASIPDNNFNPLKQEVGTSETTREAVSNFSTFNFNDYDLHKPTHIKKIDNCFLTWFIGFIEGDGSFWTRNTNVSSKFIFDQQTKRAEFEITQHVNNIKLLNSIRSKLGFSRVTTYEKNGFKYCRWYTSKRKNIIKLIYLLNGNLLLEKRQNQFKKWLNELNKAWDLKIPIKSF
jgi:hypothetical protein